MSSPKLDMSSCASYSCPPLELESDQWIYTAPDKCRYPFGTIHKGQTIQIEVKTNDVSLQKLKGTYQVTSNLTSLWEGRRCDIKEITSKHLCSYSANTGTVDGLIPFDYAIFLLPTEKEKIEIQALMKRVKSFE